MNEPNLRMTYQLYAACKVCVLNRRIRKDSVFEK